MRLCRLSDLRRVGVSRGGRWLSDDSASALFSPERNAAMDITTTRFGKVTIDEEDVLTFVDGLIGMEECRHWALLADAQNTALGWLQSLDRPEVALAVVCPRRFVADYRARVSRRDVEPLGPRPTRPMPRCWRSSTRWAIRWR